jgi:chorismate mutase
MKDSERQPSRVAAIRGAIDVSADSAAEIRAAVIELVGQIASRNRVEPAAIISAQFTMTHDLRAAFPATAAREAGWAAVPMLCTTEIDVPGALARCIRVLVHVNVAPDQQIEHIYLGKAVSLRPDLHQSGD